MVSVAVLALGLAACGTPFTPQPGREAYTTGAPDDAPPYVTFCGT